MILNSMLVNVDITLQLPEGQRLCVQSVQLYQLMSTEGKVFATFLLAFPGPDRIQKSKSCRKSDTVRGVCVRG
jgi:hypothetical protein